MIPLTNKSYISQEIIHIWKKIFDGKYADDKKYRKFRDHCHYTGKYREAAYFICSLRYSIPAEILIDHNRTSKTPSNKASKISSEISIDHNRASKRV